MREGEKERERERERETMGLNLNQICCLSLLTVYRANAKSRYTLRSTFFVF
jgi:hypothetical protein